MNFTARGRLLTKPDLVAKVRAEPLRFETGVAGSCEFRMSELNGHFGGLRIRAAIPFLKRRRLPLVATIDGFHFHLDPFEIRCGTKGVEIAGVVGVGGIVGEVAARGECSIEGEVDGRVPGTTGRIHIDFDEHRGHDKDKE